MTVGAVTDSEFEVVLERYINQRTGGRVQRLRAETNGDRVVVQGATDTYYALQLSLAAVREALESVATQHRRQVEVAISIGARPPTFRAVCTGQ